MDMKNVEMENLARDIAGICGDIIKKESIKHVTTTNEYNKTYELIKNQKKTNHELLLDLGKGTLTYINGQEKINFLIEQKKKKKDLKKPDGKITLDLLKEKRTVEKNTGDITSFSTHNITLHPGDIEINFGNSGISPKISASEDDKKLGALILGDDCFIIKCLTKGNRKTYRTILPTQNDLIVILEGLKKIA